jgi:hypothetical protein
MVFEEQIALFIPLPPPGVAVEALTQEPSELTKDPEALVGEYGQPALVEQMHHIQEQKVRVLLEVRGSHKPNPTLHLVEVVPEAWVELQM